MAMASMELRGGPHKRRSGKPIGTSPFEPELWRQSKHLPKDQGIVVGCTNSKGGTTALIDTGDVHALMIGAAGVGKTAYWLYPCIEYACASGLSFLSTDTKGDVMRKLWHHRQRALWLSGIGE